MGYSPRGRKESEMTERLGTHTPVSSVFHPAISQVTVHLSPLDLKNKQCTLVNNETLLLLHIGHIG